MEKSDIIKRRTRHCIEKIYEDDSDLIDRGNYEVTISCKLAQYLFIEFKEYDVDCEYNRHLNDKKEATINGKKKVIRPDIVIHKRGTDENNLVYLEIKTDHNAQSRKKDYDKIRAMTKQDGDYKYQLGVFIDFNRNKENLIIIFFENGDEVE